MVATKKRMVEIATAIDVKNYPVKKPNVHNFIEDCDGEEDIFEKNDDFYDKLFSKKYYLFPTKRQKTTYSQTRVYFKISKKVCACNKTINVYCLQTNCNINNFDKKFKTKRKNWCMGWLNKLLPLLKNSYKYA